MKYKRILLKLSGEFLAGENNNPISFKKLKEYAEEIKKIYDKGIEIAIVMGGGNIIRGEKAESYDRITADRMGMLATIINSIALGSIFKSLKIKAKVYSAIKAQNFIEEYNSLDVIKELENKTICILAGGTGNPFFTTDTAAALRTVELKAEIFLKGTKVDGIFDSDPKVNTSAKFFKKITYDEAIKRNLKVMDLTAFSFCKTYKIPIIVFNMNKKNALLDIIEGKEIGTFVCNDL
mgnify:CR=1 FL=1